MRRFITLFSIIYIFTYQPTNAQCGSNVLTNGSFETPVQPAIGNNLTGLFTLGGWTMIGGPFNVIRTNGTTYTGGPDNAQNGTQYVDITNAGGTIHQDFTVPPGSTLPVNFGGYFSSREQGTYVNWTASIEIVNLTTSTVVSTSSTRSFTNADGAVPTQENWYFLSGNTTLAPGNYRYRVNLGNFGNFDGAIVSLNCLLSTRITSFSGNLIAKKSILKWNCEASNDMSHFEIERSIDGRNFSIIGSELYHSNLTFEFVDDQLPSNSKIFYRLKMVDKNGSYKYSSTIIIKTKGNLILELSPNPVHDQLRVNGLQGNGMIYVYDASGRRLVSQIVAQSQTQLLDLSALKNGVYVLEYLNGEQSEIQKFVKQ